MHKYKYTSSQVYFSRDFLFQWMGDDPRSHNIHVDDNRKLDAICAIPCAGAVFTVLSYVGAPR